MVECRRITNRPSEPDDRHVVDALALGTRKHGLRASVAIKCHGALPDAMARLRLRISGNARSYSLYFDATDFDSWTPLKENDDRSILSTVAGDLSAARLARIRGWSNSRSEM
jgi:hypothetical protein